MDDLHRFVTGIDSGNEVKYQYDNLEFEYDDVKDYYMYGAAIFPLFSGMLDNFVLNGLGIYQITWFELVLLFGGIMCLLDYRNLKRNKYETASLKFWGIVLTPGYMYLRGRIVGRQKGLMYVWFALLGMVLVFAPM